jgi:hypothetical protein
VCTVYFVIIIYFKCRSLRDFNLYYALVYSIIQYMTKYTLNKFLGQCPACHQPKLRLQVWDFSREDAPVNESVL